jgi:SSS family solute:Na+ symporter
MQSPFSIIDWGVFVGYFLILLLSSWWLSRHPITTTRDYFLGGNRLPMVAVAFSILATSQSAATFLGGPDYSYSKDLTFLGFYLSSFLAIIFVAKVLIPRFYAMGAVTVYSLLEERYGVEAKRHAGVMFLIGRLFASGARLYIGALAVSMILFLDISPLHMGISIVILMASALVYSYFGGVKSVVFSDILQATTYILAGVVVLIYLYIEINMDFSQMLLLLDSHEKLKMIDTSLAGDFSIWALLGGWLLLNIGAYGLDQDITQRALGCKDSKEAQRSLMLSIYLTLPVALLFLAIGLLLHLFYHHTLGESGVMIQEFEGEKITIFMYYILHEMPEGVRGLVTVGAIAAALSSSNSVLSAMASVAIEDIYRPWLMKRGIAYTQRSLVESSRRAVLLFALLLSLMAMLSFYWQRYSDLSLLGFALGVMAFAYTGLLGLFFALIFTHRGDARRVPWALVSGFVTVLLLQPYALAGLLGWSWGFAWQIVAGTMVSFLVMVTTKRQEE